MRRSVGWGAIMRYFRAQKGAILCAIAMTALSAYSLNALAPAQAKEAESAVPPLKIAVFVSSGPDRCYDNGYVEAIEHFARRAHERINLSGELGNRSLQIEFLDDERDEKKTIANMRHVLADKQMVAMIGLGSSTRSKALFEAMGREIGDSNIPFLSDISVSSIFADYENVFTTRTSQEDERLPVIGNFIKDTKVQRPVFVGRKDAVWSAALGDGLKNMSQGPSLVADHRLALNENDEFDAQELAAVVADIKSKDADLIFLSIGSSRSGPFLEQLIAAGVTPPLFLSGRIETVFSVSGPISYPNDVYQLSWDRLPEIHNERLRQQILQVDPKSWVFGGRRNPDAPDWKTGKCKPRADQVWSDVFAAGNMRAIGRGTQYADMVALVAQTVKSAGANATVPTLRAHIAKEIKTTFASGSGIFRGNFDNWSFRPARRTATRTPLILMLPVGRAGLQLAPTQYVRLRNDVLRRIQTFYLDIDLIRLFRVDDNEKTFFAEFYLSLFNNENANIEEIDFGNAFLDPKTNNKQISINTLHGGGASDTYPENMKIYKVSGQFMFEPSFGNYPFDSQRFSINLRPKFGDRPFIIQPPPHTMRDVDVDADGWSLKDQYVSYDEDFIPLIDARTNDKSVVPFYRGNFVWLMRRQATDYYLRVVVPLAFILIIAYLSIFIPQVHFEAIVTIQVTALLSAVALYLAIPKIDSDIATLSDKIFLFDYMAVAMMIGVSILRINRFIARLPIVGWALGFIHVFIIPAMVAAIAFYMFGASLAGENPIFSETPIAGGTTQSE